ncbi:hypothetical protein ACXZ1K_05595 [Pedobacter sp. PWIIR3]
MKRNDIYLVLIALLTFGVILYACKDPGEGVTINVNTYVLKAPTAVQFVNAVNNAPNQPGTFTVTIGGKDADKVVTVDNKTDFKATGGKIFLALKKGIVPSESSPILFTVAAEVSGFAPATKSFRITRDEPLSVVVPLIEYANPLPGTAVKVQESPLIGGVSATPIVVETPSSGIMDETAKVTIPAGTQFLDASGNVISATKLESKIVQFGTESSESLAAFPGGFEISSITGPNGQPIPGGVAFVTAGFIAMDMYAGGTEVKKFSKPIDVTMGISESVVNPVTGAAVKEGDVVPVWSLDDKTGQWTFESNSTIVKDAQGKLHGSFAASHLSYWNFDWAQQFCTTPLSINFIASGNAAATYNVIVESEVGYKSRALVFIKDNTVVTERVPQGKIKITVLDQFSNIITQTGFFDACVGKVNVTFPPVASLDLVNVKMTLQGTCPNKPVNENISTFAFVYEKGTTGSAVAVYIIDGKLNLTLKNNTEYTVEALYGQKYKTTSIKFTKSDFTFPGTVSGTATYVQESNTVNVLAKFALPDCQ